MNHIVKKIEVVIKRMMEDLLDTQHEDIPNKLQEIHETLPFLGKEGREILFMHTELTLRTRILADISAIYYADSAGLSEQLTGWIETYNDYLKSAREYGFSLTNENYADYKKRRLCPVNPYTLNPAWGEEERSRAVSRVKDGKPYRSMLTAIEDLMIKLFEAEKCIEEETRRNIRLFKLMGERWDSSYLYFFDLLSFEGDTYCFTDIDKLIGSEEPQELDTASRLLRRIYALLPADVYDAITEQVVSGHMQLTIAGLLDYAENGGVEIPRSTMKKRTFLADLEPDGLVKNTRLSTYIYDITKVLQLLQSRDEADIEKAIDIITRMEMDSTVYFDRLYYTLSQQVISELCATILHEYGLPEELEKNVAFDLAFSGGPPMEF